MNDKKTVDPYANYRKIDIKYGVQDTRSSSELCLIMRNPRDFNLFIGGITVELHISIMSRGKTLPYVYTNI